MHKVLDCLFQAPVFSKLTERDRIGLVASAQEKKYRKDEFVCWQRGSVAVRCLHRFGAVGVGDAFA